MATSEIEKLERRYAENPHGLTFAPLAEVYRKTGDVPRALELLRAGLELHPNYIPASIVLGRCHQDLGDLPAAEQAFAHVLRLDDENVIALKSLADINERQDRLDEAEIWLRRLVAVDRSNDEARQQLLRLETLKQSGSRPARAPTAGAAPDAPQEVALAADEPPLPEPPLPEPPLPEPPLPSPVVAEAAETQEPADLEPLDLTEELTTSAPPRDLLKPAEEPVPGQQEPVAPEPPALQERTDASEVQFQGSQVDEPGALAGLISSEFQPPREPPSQPIGLEIETEDDVVLRSSGASEFSVPDASQDLAALAAKLNASHPRGPGRRASDRAASERRAAQAEAQARNNAAAQPEPEPGPSPEPEPSPEPVAALSVAYGVSETKGQSIAAFFQALLVARPPADPAVRASSGSPASTEGGASNVAAQDALALSSVFGEDSAPVAPAVPTPGPAKDAGVSFDDFFGSSAGGSSRTPGSTEPGKDDLDQFHSWLQNLKR
jgi:hypothetical protein